MIKRIKRKIKKRMVEFVLDCVFESYAWRRVERHVGEMEEERNRSSRTRFEPPKDAHDVLEQPLKQCEECTRLRRVCKNTDVVCPECHGTLT